MLALDAGNVVSSERLIDRLWGDDPPDDPATALQQHISRVRKLLGRHDALATRPPGYVLDVTAEQVDVTRFEKLLGDARALLHEGRAGDAAATSRAALGLWRGEALADLADEPFSAEPRLRLEERRLEALETRIAADLAAGRGAELVAELQELVREHPLRERFWGQLMLALYRAGRQADALDAFAQARRTLVAELGLEPGPELQRLQQAILTHDAELDPIRSAPGARRRGRTPVVAGAALLVAAAAAAVFALVHDRSGAEPPTPGTIAAGTIVSLDSTTGDVRRRIPAGRTPSSLAARDGVVWVVDADAHTVLRLAETSRVVETFSTGATPTDVALGAGSVWVANGRPLDDAQFVGPVATAVARLDATTGTKRGETPLPMTGGALSNLVENHLAVTRDAVWAVTPDFAVVRIERDTGAVTARSRAVPAAAVAAGDGVWVVGVDGTVALLDERTGKPVARTKVPMPGVGAVAASGATAWVTSPAEGTLWRISGRKRLTVGAIELDRGVSDVAVGAGAVWVANPLAGTVAQVDPERSTVVRTLQMGGIVRSVAVDGDTVWVSVVGDPLATGPEVAGVQPFPPPTCERVIAGEGDSDVLVASDFSLQGGTRVKTPQMAQAIAFVLRERGFRAGRFRVAYQSCDDSVGQTGLAEGAKCASNARAYARNPDVVGVIGTFNSDCAVAALPELNRAPGGPLAMVSPTNSFVGLTRASPGVHPSLPASLYPIGTRNFFRVYPSDDLQGAALALFARSRGHRTVFVLDDGQPGYGALLATGFETAARRVGLTVVGRASWDPGARRYDMLARRVARSRSSAVFVGGLLDTNAAAVVRDLRARLDGSVDLLGPDGLTSLSLLLEKAGAPALGMYVSLGGLVLETLPPAGARFAERFGRTQPGVTVEPSAVYAAQAAEVLLDAIARSDGTRGSVLRELRHARVENGLLGSFAFDENGDITRGPVTIVRLVRPGGSRVVGSIEGGVVERVLRPSQRLVAASN